MPEREDKKTLKRLSAPRCVDSLADKRRVLFLKENQGYKT